MRKRKKKGNGKKKIPQLAWESFEEEEDGWNWEEGESGWEHCCLNCWSDISLKYILPEKNWKFRQLYKFSLNNNKNQNNVAQLYATWIHVLYTWGFSRTYWISILRDLFQDKSHEFLTISLHVMAKSFYFPHQYPILYMKFDMCSIFKMRTSCNSLIQCTY